MTPMSGLLTFPLVAGLGWCLARASLCAVAATQEAVLHRRASGVYLQFVVTASAGVVLLALCLWQGAGARLPASDAALLQVALAAAAMAGGALLNGGCYLGSILYLGRGKANFLFSLLGIAVAARADVPARFGVAAHVVQAPPLSPDVLLLAIPVFLACGLFAARAAVVERGAAVGARVAHTLLAGLLAGLLMYQMPGWGYNGALAALGRLGLAPVDVAAVLLACALFAGAVLSCIAAGQWKPEAPTLPGALRCLGGGFVLESAARGIPGGNDGMLLWAMPGLGLYGFLAYGVILLVLFLAWAWAARRAKS